MSEGRILSRESRDRLQRHMSSFFDAYGDELSRRMPACWLVRGMAAEVAHWVGSGVATRMTVPPASADTVAAVENVEPALVALLGQRTAAAVRARWLGSEPRR